LKSVEVRTDFIHLHLLLPPWVYFESFVLSSDIIRKFCLFILKNSSESSLSISFATELEHLEELYSKYIDEIHGKLISIIKSPFDNTLSLYEVPASTPSDCFRILVTKYIADFHNAIACIVSPDDLILLFTRLNSIFKQLLARRLRQLNIANNDGPQHRLLTNDLLYYMEKVQALCGLQMLQFDIDEIWTVN
jgi:hypothetical protein